jgi:hypothetical protein
MTPCTMSQHQTLERPKLPPFYHAMFLKHVVDHARVACSWRRRRRLDVWNHNTTVRLPAWPLPLPAAPRARRICILGFLPSHTQLFNTSFVSVLDCSTGSCIACLRTIFVFLASALAPFRALVGCFCDKVSLAHLPRGQGTSRNVGN